VSGGELAFFTCHAPAGATLAETGAGRRRQVGGGGMLRGRQERDRPGPLPGPPLRRLHWHATLSMLALAFLQVTAAQRGHQQLWTTFPAAGAA
jgi:hypothetical protein